MKTHELLPWKRTPWHWSKHLKFRSSWILTVPQRWQRLRFFAELSNCNLATCWHIEFSILALLHLSIRIHLRISFNCSMKFFQLKITLGLALGESWPVLAQPQKNIDVHKGMLPWEGFPGQTCKNYLRRKTRMWAHGSNLDCTTILRQPWEELLPWERTPWHWSKHFQFRPMMTVPKAVFLCAADKLQCWPMLARNGTYWCMLAFSFLHLSFIGTIASVALGKSWPLLAQPRKDTDVQCPSLPIFVGRLS